MSSLRMLSRSCSRAPKFAFIPISLSRSLPLCEHQRLVYPVEKSACRPLGNACTYVSQCLLLGCRETNSRSPQIFSRYTRGGGYPSAMLEIPIATAHTRSHRDSAICTSTNLGDDDSGKPPTIAASLLTSMISSRPFVWPYTRNNRLFYPAWMG